MGFGWGGKREGAGRPRLVPANLCNHAKPVFASGRERKACYACVPKPAPSPRKPYAPKHIVIARCHLEQCGSEFIPVKSNQKYCCTKCRNRAGNTSERMREACKGASGVYRERARRYGGEYAPFNLLKVFERDGWICMCCGIATPKALRGKWVHNAPELDHKIPLARRGAHSVENCQCLCRSCNSLKRDRTMEEFMEWLGK